MVGTSWSSLVFEAARRVLGIALPIVCGLFLLYGLFGQYLPGELAHRPYDYARSSTSSAFGTEGIYGIPTLVSATYIFLFILFGAFLEHAGMIKLFNDLALGLVGHTKGGPAKVAVISSGFMGTISRLGRGQRADGGPVHHPADEALRLLAGVRRRGRGDLEHGRADHAAGDGRGRLHHGRDAERALRRRSSRRR